MGMLDSILGQVAGNMDVKNLAEKVGLPADVVESAVTALGQAHPQPGDTVSTAADATGLPTDKLQEILGHLGGEGSLTQIASILGGDTSSLGGSLGGLGSLFGKS